MEAPGLQLLNAICTSPCCYRMLDSEDVDVALISHDVRAKPGAKRPAQYNSFVACTLAVPPLVAITILQILNLHLHLLRFPIFSLPIGSGAFLVNYALGVGMLGTPYAFAQSGLVLGVAFMVGITFIGVITAMWIIDVRRPQTARTAPSLLTSIFFLCFQASARANALMAAAAEEESAIVADPMGLASPINSTEQWIAPPSYIHWRLTTCFRPSKPP